MARETIGKTLAVATAVCVVCSVLVSTMAVALKPTIERNKTVDKYRNILIAAGVEGAETLNGKGVEIAFGDNIETIVIDIETGQMAPDNIDPAKLDERKAAKDPAGRIPLPESDDDPGIKWLSKYQSVYRTKEGAAEPRIILPVHGKGLWSTMYGFVALDAGDLTTIKNFAFYEHGETPGLGGEVDNETWKQVWVGKMAYDGTTWEPQIKVVKGRADRSSPYDIDGLAGATLTANGVHRLVRFWLSENGYAKYLQNLKKQRTGEQNG